MNDTTTDDIYEATRSTMRLYDALELLEKQAGVEPGSWFRTTRVAWVVESGLQPMTADCSKYILSRDQIIEVDGKPGRGTMIRIKRRLTAA